MFVGSHFRIGSFVYKSVLTKYQKKSLLNQYLFKWGNVLPDIYHELSKVDHYIEFTLDYVEDLIQIIQDRSNPSFQRSISLGIVCHFLSDYFCAYHALAPYKKRSILQHLIYELKLDICLTYCLLFPKQLKKKLSICEETKYPTIKNIILSLQLDYFKEKPSIMNDILFALRATSIAVAHLQETTVNSVENELEVIWWSHNSSERSFQ